MLELILTPLLFPHQFPDAHPADELEMIHAATAEYAGAHVHEEPAPEVAPAAQPARDEELEPAYEETSATTTGVWDQLAECEANGEWDYGPHSGWGSGIFHGGLQFHPTTWSEFAPSEYPSVAYEATRDQQIAVAEKVLESQGWGAWPSCSKQLGLR